MPQIVIASTRGHRRCQRLAAASAADDMTVTANGGTPMMSAPELTPSCAATTPATVNTPRAIASAAITNHRDGSIGRNVTTRVKLYAALGWRSKDSFAPSPADNRSVGHPPSCGESDEPGDHRGRAGTLVISYLDTSAAMKLLVEEGESEALVARLESAEHDRRLVASWLLHTETAPGRRTCPSNDAMHLAVALRVGAEEIFTYDAELAAAASAAGLAVVQPT
jgi:predicted nucleic acid-binding protein